MKNEEKILCSYCGEEHNIDEIVYINDIYRDTAIHNAAISVTYYGCELLGVNMLGNFRTVIGSYVCKECFEHLRKEYLDSEIINADMQASLIAKGESLEEIKQYEMSLKTATLNMLTEKQ